MHHRLLAFLIFFLPWVPLGADAATEPEAHTIRVMSYNIQHGRGMDGVIDIERIAAVIRAENVDLVALQEVDQGVARTDGIDIPAELSRRTGMAYFFDKNIDFQGGAYGNAVLSRFPIVEAANEHLRMLRENEQRGVIYMQVEVSGQRLLFMNTHIDYRRDDSERLANVAQFAEILERHRGLPVIFCGDFNDFPGSNTHAGMKKLLSDVWETVGEGDGFSFRADDPDRRIDYIWYAADSLKPVKAWIKQTLASDHLPLSAEFQLRRESAQPIHP